MTINGQKYEMQDGSNNFLSCQQTRKLLTLRWQPTDDRHEHDTWPEGKLDIHGDADEEMSRDFGNTRN